MKGISLVSYTASYPLINLELKKNNPKFYDGALISLHIDEFKKGNKIVKVYKTTKKGTDVKFKSFESLTEVEDYYKLLQCMIDDYHVNYGKRGEYYE